MRLQSVDPAWPTLDARSWLVYCRAIWAPRREFGSVDSHVLLLAHLHLKPGFRVGWSSKYSSVDVAQWN